MTLFAPLQLWRDVEMFQAFDLDEVLMVEDNSWHVSLREPLYPQVPWIDPDMWGLNPEYNYGFDLFIGIFEKEVSHSVVRELYGQADFAESFDDAREPEGTTCVARLGISSRGEPLIEDCRISTHPWALTAIRRNQELSLDAFDAYGRDLLMRISSCRVARRAEGSEGIDDNDFEPISWDGVRAINMEARRDLKLEWRNFEDRVVIVAHRLGKKRPLATTAPQPEGTRVGAAATQEHLTSQHPESTPPTHESSITEVRTGSVAQPRIKRRCEILNSFFLRDLQRVAQHIGKLHKNSALSRYLSAAPLGHRTDVAKPSPELWASVAPNASPLGRWPHDPRHFNALMQQLAVNEYASGKHSLFAVNGPPGTGKTTLVKDVVAAAVVARALKLVRYRSADDAFEKKSVSCEVDRSRFVVRKLKRDLVGFEVVIASSNNNAVENITRQLPKRSGLGECFQGSAYLPEVARLYEGIRTGRDSFAEEAAASDCWGFISIPLGNRRNREAFCDALLYGPREEKDEKSKRQKRGEHLTLHEWRKQIPPPGTISFAKARLDFLAAHKHVEELLEQLGSQVSHQLEEGTDSSEHFIRPNDQDFNSLSVQERAPWLTERLNEAHSKLFLAALGLHQAWIREASALGPNLVALGKMLGRPDAFEESIAVYLWQTLFMVVPAISTTLASVERMCCNVREGAFGTLVLEEAGQATPQSVAGLMWRAKRALVIGDPMQIQPVVSAPEVLVRHFCKRHKVTNPLFSPLASSAQALADESNELGTYLDHSLASTWVGAPLRVHRRCIEPMFSIANTIAYSGLMTYGTRESERQLPQMVALPDSAWFDTGGPCVGRHWVPQHGAVAYRLLEQILRQQAFDQEPDFFIVTPFRSVREPLAKVVAECAKALGTPREQIAALRRRVGTVHTFQGKEASVVAFVLGCDESTRGAARWAGERPNLVNVAVTRARHRLYVIGDLSLWHNQGFFSELANSLPRMRMQGDVFCNFSL